MSRGKTSAWASQLASWPLVSMVVDRDEPDARLDQPAGQQQALPVLGAAVAVAEPGVFLVEPEGAADGSEWSRRTAFSRR